jgi:hypothetical protein
MRARTTPRRSHDRPPYIHVNGHVFCLPSMVQGVRLVKIVDHYNDALIARKASSGGVEARHNARVVACMGAVVGALWWATDADLATPLDRGPWTALDTADADAVEAWGDAVVGELLRPDPPGIPWTLSTIGEVFAVLAPALVELCTIRDAEVKARADFSAAPGPTNG